MNLQVQRGSRFGDTGSNEPAPGSANGDLLSSSTHPKPQPQALNPSPKP